MAHASAVQDVNNWLGRSAYGRSFANCECSEVRINAWP